MIRELQPCGTDGAYQRHLRARETPDQACIDAHAKHVRDWEQRCREGNGPRLPIRTHGTRSGYHAHRRRHEKPCEACFTANSEYQLGRRRAAKSARAEVVAPC